MSWGLTFTGYASRIRKDQVPVAIEDCEQCIRLYQNRLIAMCSLNATRCHVDGDEVPWYEHVAQEVPNLIEGIREEAGRLAILQQVMMSDNVEED